MSAHTRVILAAWALSLMGCGPDGGPPAVEKQPTAPELSDEDRAALQALGYINTVPAAVEDGSRSGVTSHDRKRACAGENLFNPRDESTALLMDMEGKIVRRWASPVVGETYRRMKDRFPMFMPSYLEGWNLAELTPDGDLLVIGTHHMLLRLGRDSEVEWKLDLSVHHDLDLTPGGDIVVLEDSIRVAPFEGGPVAFQDNSIVVVSAAGRVERRISLFDAMGDATFRELIDPGLRRVVEVRSQRLAHLVELGRRAGPQGQEIARLYGAVIKGDLREDPGVKNVLFHGQAEDIFHANSVQILSRDLPGRWRAGDFLVSIRNLDLVVVIDHATGKVVWSWGRDEIQRAHHATEVEGGNIQLFDNGTRRGHSRIIEVDPRSGKIVWSYEGKPRAAFFSGTRGSCQRLPGGNVLISETDRGRVFEIDRSGEIVWSYLSALRPRDPRTPAAKKAPERAAIYRMTRLVRNCSTSR